jgi:hypothetical protein
MGAWREQRMHGPGQQAAPVAAWKSAMVAALKAQYATDRSLREPLLGLDGLAGCVVLYCVTRKPT